MASNVNVKFVAILASSLLLLATVVAAAAYITMKNTAEDHVKAGDKFMAASEYEDATRSYSKAVNKDQTNVPYLHKWQEALVNSIPETDLEYSQGYSEHYIGILRRLAALQVEDPQAQRDMIDATYNQIRFSGADAQGWSTFLNTCDSAFERLDMIDDPAAKSLLRYRGFGRVALMPLVATTLKEHDQGVEDLNAAFEADPTDIEALIKLADLYRLDWIQALTINRPAAIANSMGKLTATIDLMREGFTDDPRFLARELNFILESKIRVDSSLAGQLRIREELRGVEEPVIELFLACDPEKLSTELLLGLFATGRAIWNVRPEDYNEIGLQVTERVLESRPDDFDLQYFVGVQLMIANRFDDAHEAFQRCIDYPDLPISLDGLRLKQVRVTSRFQQASNAMIHLGNTEDEQARAALLEKINTLYETIADDQGENSSMALMIGAKLASAEQRYSEAVSMLQQLDTQTDSGNIDVIRLLARSLAAQGTLGAALDQYDRWIELDDVNPQPLLESAQIHLRLRDPEMAISRLSEALTILPDNQEIQLKLNSLIASTRADSNLTADDPVIAEMMKAETLANSGGDSLLQAIETLIAITETSPDDARPLAMLTEYLARSGDTEEALKYANRGLEILPGNETFLRYIAMLSTGDRMQIALDYIDKGLDPEPIKLIKKYALMSQMENPESAESFLNDAIARYPAHPAVLDARFVEAIKNDDMAAAREVANIAAENNSDQAGGLLYQARIFIREENLAAALNSLELAVQKASLSPQAWRLYGQVLLLQGRTEEGLEALAKANKYKPDDTEISKAYASTLIQLQRYELALEVVRLARRFTVADTRLNEMWLALESQAGDTNLSIEHRFARYENSPDDTANTRSLIALLTAEGRFDEAGELIQQSLDAGGSDLGLTITQARWFADQGKIDEGHRLILQYIEELDPAELNEVPYLAMGNFLINQGHEDEGVDAFRQGAEFQSMDMMSADRRLGDYFFANGVYNVDSNTEEVFSNGMFEKAYESYHKVTEAGADETGVVSKRIIETLQRLQRWDDAETELNKLTAGVEEDYQTTLLRVDIANGRGDARGAKDLVNRAVELAPNKPEPYIRRAQLEFNIPERLSFVLSDLAQAIRLSPTAIQPRMMRARILQRNKRSAEAIAELRRGIESIPDNSELRRMLIQELWETNRHDEAHAAAQQAIESNDQNPVWLMVAGDIASRDQQMRDNWTVARGHFEKAHKIDPSLMLTLRVANSCLYQTPPDAEAAIKIIATQGELQETESQLLILKARATDLLGDHDEAVRLAARSVVAAEDVGQLRHWFLHMEVVFEKRDEMIAFVDESRPQDFLMPAYIVHAAAFQAFDRTRHARIISGLHESEKEVIQFATDDRNSATLVALYRVLGQLEYGQGNYAAAEDAFASGIRILPNDMEFNNNLAYTRAKYLNDLEGALGPAEHAVELSPANSPALDTLGWIYYRLGRLGQAKQKITRAINNAESPLEKGGSFLHMAQVLLAEGDRPEARKYAELANDIIKLNPALGAEFNTDFEALMTELQEAENTN